MINLEWLHAFVVFSEHLNFTHAARALHLSQPALHARIQNLSQDLGTALYLRQGRRLTLTPEGEYTANFGREMLERTHGFRARVLGRPEHQPVVLAAGEGSYLYLLGWAVQHFVAQPNRARLRLLTTRGPQTVEHIRAGKAHLGVAAFDLPPEGLETQVLTTVEQTLILPQTHPLASKEHLTLHDLEGLRLVVPPPDRAHRRTLERALRSAGVSWEVAVEATGWALMLHFVRLGLGLAVVNGFCQAPENFVARPIRGLPSLTYLLLQQPDRTLAPETMRLRALLLQYADHWRTSNRHTEAS